MKNKSKTLFFMLLVIFMILSFSASCSNKNQSTHWIGAWNGSATDFTFFKLNYKDQTIRTIVTSTFQGSKERIKISNEYGTEALKIGAATFALVNDQGIIDANSKKAVTFQGKANVTIEKGAFIWSDPFEANIKALDKVALSIYLPGEVKSVTGTSGGAEGYFSERGNFLDSVSTKKDFKPIGAKGFPKVSPFFISMEVMTSEKNRSIIAFGDSITTFSWPDHLAKRLKDADIKNLSVIREAIGGNRILHNSESKLKGLFGTSGISRFEKAITDHKGVKYVIVLEGVNDIMHTGPGGPAPASEVVTNEEIINGLEKYIELAHKHKVKIYGGTIMPFEGYTVYNEELENKRKEVNEWIRTSGRFDGVIDFDKATCDPNNPSRLLPQYDSGDHLHPKDEGSKAMAEAVHLELFK